MRIEKLTYAQGIDALEYSQDTKAEDLNIENEEVKENICSSMWNPR